MQTTCWLKLNLGPVPSYVKATVLTSFSNSNKVWGSCCREIQKHLNSNISATPPSSILLSGSDGMSVLGKHLWHNIVLTRFSAAWRSLSLRCTDSAEPTDTHKLMYRFPIRSKQVDIILAELLLSLCADWRIRLTFTCLLKNTHTQQNRFIDSWCARKVLIWFFKNAVTCLLPEGSDGERCLVPTLSLEFELLRSEFRPLDRRDNQQHHGDLQVSLSGTKQQHIIRNLRRSKMKWRWFF